MFNHNTPPGKPPEVIVIAIFAVIAMARGWEDIERYGKAKEAGRCFMNRVRAVKKEYGREIIATGGKTERGISREGENPFMW